VRLDAVRAHADHHCVNLPEPGKGVAKIARFGGSPGGVVLWIKEQDNILSGE